MINKEYSEKDLEENRQFLKKQMLQILNELEIVPTQGIEIFEGFFSGLQFNINKKDSHALQYFGTFHPIV